MPQGGELSCGEEVGPSSWKVGGGRGIGCETVRGQTRRGIKSGVLNKRLNEIKRKKKNE